VIGSVRARLTLAVTAVVGGLAITSAIVAPRLVDDALVDDRLDAEVGAEEEAWPERGSLVTLFGSEFGAPELTALFGPEIAEVTSALEPTGALDELRNLHPDGALQVSPAPGIVATVRTDGLVRFDETVGADASGPVVTTSRLQDLAVEMNVSPLFDGPFDLFADTEFSFDDFLNDIDARFDTDLGEQLDITVFEAFPALGDEEIPRGVFDILREGFDERFVAEITEDDLREPTVSADEFVFGVRSVDGADVIVAASGEDIARSVDRVRTALWLAVPVVMLLAGGLTWLLAGRTLRPVREITDRTSRIRAGTLHERVPVPGSRDEVAGLASEMNEMLDRVQREDDRRRQFVADASHELRSPIAAIRTQAEAALVDGATTETAELATGVLAESSRMGVLVDDLLALARHDEQLAPPGTILDLDDLVLADARRPRRVPVDTSAVSAGRVRGRDHELARVVTHLLDNAARHARSKVMVELATTSDQVHLIVDDDGPGVPSDERERVFERFVRLDDARERDAGGAGLGLAVVASVVRAGGGGVLVSESPTGGARFEVTLPAAS
jgi:signal transduction histidine kinase